MRRSIPAAVVAAIALAAFAIPAAGAPQPKPRASAVQERSIFDLGNVGRTSGGSNYVQQGNYASRSYSNIGEFYGSGTLPEGRGGR